MNILVDSSVILDLLARFPRRMKKARAALEAACAGARPAYNLAVYAEVALAFRDVDALDDALHALGLRHAPVPKEAAFLAGRAFFAYRAKGGKQRRPSTGFLAGAHASVEEWPVLTLRPTFYRRHFPRARLVIWK
jgi:predicted nucleic acid-binding protein